MFNFEFLDDTFFAVDYPDNKIRVQDADAISIVSDSRTGGSEESVEMYVNGALNRLAMSEYAEDVDVLKNCHPLMSLVRFGRTELHFWFLFDKNTTC